MDYKVPEKITSGYSYEFALELPAYPPDDGWSVSLAIRLPGVAAQKVEAVHNGSVYVFAISPSVSGALPGGLAAWQCSAERSDIERVLVDQGRMEISPDLMDDDTDPRSKAEMMIDAIDAVLQDRATDGQSEIMYNGRQLKYMPVGDLLRLRSYYLDLLPEAQNEPNCELIRFGNVR
jgi:hypothetical protein